MVHPALYIGLMSGTSLDAVDGVLVDFSRNQPLLASTTQSIPADLRNQLLSLCQSGEHEIQRIAEVEPQLTHLYIDAVNTLLAKSGKSHSDIKAIGNHGQTIRHLPELGYTLQIGDPNLLAEHTKIAVVADFRRRDMAAGGEGAPLVPAFHQTWLSSNTSPRIIINIGGMANISCLNTSTQETVTGFDTGPGNVLMDSWCHQHNGTPYDASGAWANTGKINERLLQRMLADEYLQRCPPKSTGRERFNESWLEQFSDICNTLPAVDVQASLLELTAQSIAQAITQWATCSNADAYVCGGGAHNKALMNRLQQLLPDRTIKTTSTLGIEPDWVEAIAFAWLAKQRIELQPGNLPTVTRARGERMLGAIYPP